MSDAIFGGIEGGASRSCAVLYNAEGKELAMVRGPHTNHWLLGMDETHKRLNNLVLAAFKQAHLPPTTTLKTLGLSLSGCEGADVCKEMEDGMATKYPTLSEKYVAWSDTVAPVIVANEQGGAVLITGTGTNALLINPDGSQHRCGGWGSMLGDEGGAYWIAQKLIKVYVDDQDKFAPPPHNYSTERVGQCVTKYLKLNNLFDLLSRFYRTFEKSHIAGLTKLFADMARDGDRLCQWAFKEAGKAMAQHLAPIAIHAHQSLLECDGGLPVMCVGSVWKSWDLLKPGFVEYLDHLKESESITEASLIRLKVSVASGASFLAAKTHGYNFPRNDDDTFEVIYHYLRNHKNCCVSETIVRT